jgi:hypothetical protein
LIASPSMPGDHIITALAPRSLSLGTKATMRHENANVKARCQ